MNKTDVVTLWSILIFSSTVEMIKLTEEDMSKTKMCQNLGLLYQTVNQAMDAKEKFLREFNMLL